MKNEKNKHYLIAEEPCGCMEDEEEITKRVKGVNREKPEWMRIIMKALEEIPDLMIVPIPGANAAISALSVSGFATDKFVFLGFPPHKKGRQTFFKNIAIIDETVVFYESKHRILKALDELKKLSNIDARKIMVGRELTKQFETIYRGDIDHITKSLSGDNLLGEFVVVIANK